jgi:SAM domain (Sterile alpha motif)
VTSYTEGFSHFVTSMTAPVASGWSVRRVGFAPTGKRRLLTAHTNSSHSPIGVANGSNRPHSGPPTLPTWTRNLPGTIMRVEPCAGTTMNVAQWLNAIDLGQYEALFREHEIDANVLPDLVEADLEKVWRAARASQAAHAGDCRSLRGRNAAVSCEARLCPAVSVSANVSRCRTAADHGDVLRSRRLDRPCGAA